MFNKKEYWKRRNNINTETEVAEPLRGQGDKPLLRVQPGKSPQHLTFLPGGKKLLVNRAQARRRHVSRDYTKPNYGYRMNRADSSFSGHNDGSNEFMPHYPPEYSNHKRMLLRAERRRTGKVAV
ncbi:MAG TPA: hypothetical protein VFT87_01055 [Candidatus Saccharimonadales bacterium]|nr:hypothetical protein [Candidatus Saccharimonadales bacterium]